MSNVNAEIIKWKVEGEASRQNTGGLNPVSFVNTAAHHQQQQQKTLRHPDATDCKRVEECGEALPGCYLLASLTV